MKQFKNKKEFDEFIRKMQSNVTVEEMMAGKPTKEDIIAELLHNGYTDLDNLVADGHAYEIGGHTNHGWLYEDEADLDYLRACGLSRDIRKRSATPD